MRQRIEKLVDDLKAELSLVKENYNDVGVPPHQQIDLEARMDVLEDVISSLQTILEGV